jgi:hypothetical protein
MVRLQLPRTAARSRPEIQQVVQDDGKVAWCSRIGRSGRGFEASAARMAMAAKYQDKYLAGA